MPWQETDVVKERTKFILEWERRFELTRGDVNLSELCRAFGITRQCGHKWLARYRAGSEKLEALAERSRRPHNSPHATPPEVEDFLVATRKKFPRWGPKKLRSWLEDRYVGPWPSKSAIALILKRRGLVRVKRKARKSYQAIVPPFAEATAPNAVWCVDFKGWFRTLDGNKCHVLTILDAHTRFLLRCEVLENPDGREVQAVFDSAFWEFGLPTAIRFDGGPPFVSNAPAGLSRLSVWWLRLGLQLQRIAPGKPQQNGRQERMHRTLKAEVKICADLREQQRELDEWRKLYNDERPHEALNMRPPATAYSPSRKVYPRPLHRHAPFSFEREVTVDRLGFIPFKRRKVLISSALAHERIQLFPEDAGVWDISFGSIPLGKLDETRPERGLIVKRQRRREHVSTMSLD
jgi:putative transposase